MSPRGTSRTTRLRKASCCECGYIIRLSRSCMTRGLPSCPCGAGELTPDDPADLIELGLLTLDDLARPVRTELCRRMGWEDAIIRTSPGRRKRVEPLPF